MNIEPTIIVAVIMSLPGLYALFIQRRKDQADVAAKYGELAMKQAIDNSALEAENEKLKKRIAKLERQIRELGAVPVNGDGGD